MPPPPSPHGTRNRYTTGCRCDECVEARRAWVREYRQRPDVRERELERAREWKRRRRAWVSEYNRQYKLKKKGNRREGIAPMPVAPYYRFLKEEAA